MSRFQNLHRLVARIGLTLFVLVASVSLAAVASAQSLNLKLRTPRGDGAVYQPGDPISLSVKTNRDAHLIVYEIDAEGSIHVLFPTEDNDTSIEGGTTLDLPENADEQLVVEGPVGEGYIVAIASEDPFRQLPWYLRPPDPRAQELGYTPDERDKEGVTSDGKIVGDPFVAMERIRRQVVADGVASRDFATAYTSYYVHNEVRYPRYLCNDCHRPGYYAWWDGFDPYYANCSVFEFRVNSHWWWGPTYWTGFVPYYAYVYRTDCPPRYRPRGQRGAWYSSWDGWSRWKETWGGPLRRIKSTPPSSYVPPARWGRERGIGNGGGSTPPGFFASAHDRWSRTNLPGGGQPSSGIRRERVGNGAPSGGANEGSRTWSREGRSRSGGREGVGNGSTTPTPTESGRNRRGWDQGGNGSGNNRRGGEVSAPAPAPSPAERESRPQPDQGQWTPRRQVPAPEPAPRTPERGEQRPEREREVEAPRSNDPPPQSAPPPQSDDRPRRSGGGGWKP